MGHARQEKARRTVQDALDHELTAGTGASTGQVAAFACVLGCATPNPAWKVALG
jgi:hypothetical protein